MAQDTDVGNITQPQVLRTRVNSTFMQQNHGRQVCLLGIVSKGDGGQAFTVKASDGGLINVRLKQPLSEPISGLVEVIGLGQGKNLIVGESYLIFPPEVQINFDMAAYNEMVTLLNTIDATSNPWRV